MINLPEILYYTNEIWYFINKISCARELDLWYLTLDTWKMRVLITAKIELNSEMDKGNEGKKKGGKRDEKGKWREGKKDEKNIESKYT